jgi:hypothetical protein
VGVSNESLFTSQQFVEQGGENDLEVAEIAWAGRIKLRSTQIFFLREQHQTIILPPI